MQKIAEALLKFQSKNISITKNATSSIKFGTNSFTHRYANLDEILATIRPILTELGLFIFHQIEDNKLITTLYHTSGESISSSIDIPNNLSPQQLGSFFTYMKRYSISAMLCLASEEDDDANIAENKHVKKANNSETQKTNSVKSNEVQQGLVLEFNGVKYNELEFIAEMKDCQKFPEYKDLETGDFDEMLLFIYCIDLIKSGRKDEVKEHVPGLSERNKAIMRQIFLNPNHYLLKLRV